MVCRMLMLGPVPQPPGGQGGHSNLGAGEAVQHPSVLRVGTTMATRRSSTRRTTKENPDDPGCCPVAEKAAGQAGQGGGRCPDRGKGAGRDGEGGQRRGRKLGCQGEIAKLPWHAAARSSLTGPWDMRGRGKGYSSRQAPMRWATMGKGMPMGRPPKR